MNIFKQIKQDIFYITNKLNPNYLLRHEINIESSKDPLNGDLSSNVAMLIAAKDRSPPREVALKYKNELLNLPYIAHIEIAGPGFINFTIKANYWQDCIKYILNDNNYLEPENIGQKEKINIEYVSSNPTGPMHIGHARCAVFGDVLAKILIKCGYDVTKEYYINDAGTQVKNLTNSVLLRYKELITQEKIEFTSDLYPGEYLIDVAKKLIKIYGKNLLDHEVDKFNDIIKDFTIIEMMTLIKTDLINLGVEHDIFTSENLLYQNYDINLLIEELTKKGKIYYGTLPPPKGKEDENWIERPQLLFKATDYEDNQDRPLQKSNLEWTYLASDFLLAQDKIKRGFTTLIYVLGADHSGYIKRMKAIVKALANESVKCDVKICQMVNLVEDKIPLKMSKRKGTFITVAEVIEAVGKDIIRFMMLTRRNDVTLEFDLKAVKQQSKENPIFYIQYANVRTNSILANAKDLLPSIFDQFISSNVDLSLLDSEEEIQLIKLLASWSRVFESAAKFFEPHRLAFYLLDVATKFHFLWNLGKTNNDYRFINTNNLQLTAARIALASAVQKIILLGLEIIGIEPLDKM